MHDYLLSALLGVIEGLTEFLPVSSTAHLRVAEEVLGISLHDGYWKMYSIVIQLGAILAVMVYFRRRIAGFLGTFPKGERGNCSALTHPLGLLMLAFGVTAIPAFFMAQYIGKNLESTFVMGMSLLIGGIVMWIVDLVFRSPRILHMEEMHTGHAIWIGAAQVLAAMFPGTSRSMVTIAAGQIAGMSREAALEFSFFLSIPTMVFATSFQLLASLLPRHHSAAIGPQPIAMDGHLWTTLGIGFAVSFLVALAVIAWFMHWVRRHGFVPFAIYRIVLGFFLLFAFSRSS